jgi:hypothetical protein
MSNSFARCQKGTICHRIGARLWGIGSVSGVTRKNQSRMISALISLCISGDPRPDLKGTRSAGSRRQPPRDMLGLWTCFTCFASDSLLRDTDYTARWKIVWRKGRGSSSGANGPGTSPSALRESRCDMVEPMRPAVRRSAVVSRFFD